MINVQYDFYKEYASDLLEKILEKRVNSISLNHFGKKIPSDNFLSEFFVDVFCWSVFPKKILREIETILLDNQIQTIYDLSCGNGFHIFLFNQFTKINGVAIDIQNEENSWSNIIVQDARLFLQNLIQSTSQALLLSWIDYDELALNFAKNYHGNIIISVGNYELRSTKYLKYVHDHFYLIKRFILKLPWNRTEKIEIYCRSSVKR